MKFDFLQGDFSSGELSPRARGHADSDAYKSGLGRAANVAPTRTGSIASRAGLMTLVEGIDGHTGAPLNSPVQHIEIHDGPYGDFVIEVSLTGIRMLDKNGVLPWDLPPTSEFIQFTVQDGAFAYGDPKSRTVYLRSTDVARMYALTRDAAGISGAQLPASVYVSTPAGTTDQWIFSGKIAGDAVTAHIVQSNPANFQDIAITPDASGNFSITFRPNIGGAGDQDFTLQLVTAAGTTATTIWDINLTKNGVKTLQDTTTAILSLPTGNTTPLAVVASTQERVRAAPFWAQGNFWIALAGGPGNCYAGFALRYNKDPINVLLTKWTFGTLPCTANSLAQIVGANAVAAFQDRLWYGINLPNGKRVIRASAVGYGHAWGYGPQANATGAGPFVNGKDWLFQFIVETERYVCPAVLAYHFPCVNAKANLVVTVDNQIRFESPDYTLAGHEMDFRAGVDIGEHNDQNVLPGGSFDFRQVPPNALPAGISNGDVILVTRVALADDPLDLSLASPSGKIAWLNVLRGLVLGTTRNEKLFERGVSLTIDPATGQSFNIEDESSYGADPALQALDINDKVLFVQQGRKVLRYAGISISSNGGLVSEDIGVAGEHLTNARVRSLCFLKSPVPRAVFAFDDGTGAVMTIIRTGVVAFSRLTIPACFGGIYSVAALNTDEDSELWVGTENGVTLRAATFESDIEVKEIQLPQAYPAAPIHFKYDTETPLPPVMDGWKRLPLVNRGGAQYVTGLPACAVGQSAWILANGQVNGPYVVIAGGKVDLTGLAFDTTWVDASGVRRAQEVYAGLLFPEHKFTTLPLEGGNPVGSSQHLTSRKPQLYLRLVDSYLPLVNGKRLAERGPTDSMDELGARVTDDRRATEEGFQRGGVVDVVMDLPLRIEISAVHGGVVMNNI